MKTVLVVKRRDPEAARLAAELGAELLLMLDGVYLIEAGSEAANGVIGYAPKVLIHAYRRDVEERGLIHQLLPGVALVDAEEAVRLLSGARAINA